MDLRDLDTVATSNEGADLHLLHPGNGEPVGITITLAGPDSDVFKKARYRARNTTRQMMMKRGGKVKTAEEEEQEDIEGYAGCTLAWDGVEEHGKKLKCTRDNAIHLYTRYPWIREQVNFFIGDRANFTKPSSLTSATTQDTSSS